MKISNVTHGSINVKNRTMTIEVPANDHPYGLFQFQNKQLSVRESQVLKNVLCIKPGSISEGTFFFNFLETLCIFSVYHFNSSQEFYASDADN